MPQSRLSDCVGVNFFSYSGAAFTVIPRSIFGRIKEIVPVKEFPIDYFEFSLARSEVTVVSRAKAELDVALDTEAGRVTLRNVSGYGADAPMNILLMDDDVLQLLSSTCSSKRLPLGK